MRNTLRIFYIVLLLGVMICSDNAEALESSDFPSLVSSVRITGPVDFCGESVPLDDQEVHERLEKEMLLILWNRAQVLLWLKRTGRYMPYIEKMLRENGLPDDLKYSAVVESSLMSHARSSKYATGFWQFIKSTGIRYGLTINSDVDERRNVRKSTEAAMKYLRKLYSDFGSWTLAVAAYNMGEAGLRRNIEFQKTSDFYHLYLPLETQRHLLKIVAVKLILSNPDKYGFRLTKEDFYSPVAVDHVQVDCSDRIPVRLIAEAAETYYKTVRDLNPEVRGRNLSQGRHSIALPKGTAGTFHARYESLYAQWRAENRQVRTQARKVKAKKKKSTYVVRKGDSLSKIASKFRVPLSKLLKWNRLSMKSHIYPGKRLIVRR